MVGPVILVVGLIVAGAISGGVAGAVAGALVAAGLLGALVAGAALWSARVRGLLEPDVARAHAPRPPGFGRLMDTVYDRTLR